MSIPSLPLHPPTRLGTNLEVSHEQFNIYLGVDDFRRRASERKKTVSELRFWEAHGARMGPPPPELGNALRSRPGIFRDSFREGLHGLTSI